jgi:DNA repair exonuclease SbcCD nuclease subunit
MFKFLHAADLHMDSPLAGLTSLGEDIAKTVATASRKAFKRMLDLARSEKVQFMVISGDILDGAIRDHGTIQFLLNELGVLAQTIPVYLIRGNHDALNTAGTGIIWPANVFELAGDQASTLMVHGIPVAIHGQSFKERATQENLVRGYPAAVENHFNIGILHTSLAGLDATHDRYAPTSVDELVGKGYHYWALGHIHKREIIRGGSPWIVYPGNIQGRSVRETGPRGCAIVRVDSTLNASAQFVDLDEVRFHEVEVDLTGVDSIDHWGDKLRDSVKHLPWANANAIRIRFTGNADASNVLPPGALLRQEVRQRLAGLGKSAVLEKIKIECATASSAAGLLANEEDLFAEIIADWKANPELLKNTLKDDEDIMALTKKLERIITNEAEVDALINNIDNLDSVIQVLQGKSQD